MLPATRDLTIYQGDAYDHEASFVAADGTPLDMTGTWRAQLRRSTSTAEPATSFAIDDTDAATGVLVLSLTAAQTAALTAGKYVWDLEDTATASTYLRGQVEVIAQVSR